jgi:ectoine hydroxylase-related dioxygenase (phytanoyl-CoA dioxygenase family)
VLRCVTHRPCARFPTDLEPVSVAVHQPTAWIPLVPATKENGCMEVLAHGHRSGLECRHECCGE